MQCSWKLELLLQAYDFVPIGGKEQAGPFFPPPPLPTHKSFDDPEIKALTYSKPALLLRK